MADWKFNKSETNGKVSELIFEIFCHEHGLEAAKPINSIAPYDYLLFLNSNWVKVQVKTIYKSPEYEALPNRPKGIKSRYWLRFFHSTTTAKSHSGERRYKKGDFDYVFGTTGEEHWMVPFSAVVGKWNILVDSKKYAQYKVT